MKKFLALFLVMALVVPQMLFAGPASTYKYEIRIVDQFDEPIASGATLRVKTVNTNTDASVWPTPNTMSGTLSGAVTPDSMGIARFYSTETSHDVIVHYRGKVYAYMGVTPGSDRRIEVQKFDAAINLDTDAIASSDTLTVPLKGNFFRVTGTTNINNISSTGQQIGKEIALLFSGQLSLGENGNISMGRAVGTVNVGGTLQVASGTVIKFLWDGTKWRAV